LKSGDVELILSTPVCPGKHIVMVSGRVESVKSSIKTGEIVGGIFIVQTHLLTNIDETIIPAISGTADISEIKSLGIIETISALTSIQAGDIAVKASKVKLIEIRIARGLGGKGFMIITGEISSVKSAIDSCLNELKDSGSITSYSVISSPHKDIINSIY
ncbi:MAG: BMC domain-containing protein, partial [Bacillota bacterium]|nr:BMC domain-containing protein [Bacillota bacterium]